MATKRENLEGIVAALMEIGDNDNLVEFALREIELIDKRADAPRKETPIQVENAALKVTMVEMLEDKTMTATEIAEAVGKSVQKVAQLLRQLVKDELVVRTEGKGKEKTTFTAA